MEQFLCVKKNSVGDDVSQNEVTPLSLNKLRRKATLTGVCEKVLMLQEKHGKNGGDKCLKLAS